MARPIEQIEFSRVNDCAHHLGDAAIVAYYIKRPGTPNDVSFHYATVRRELDRLCELLGLRVVDADETAPLDGAMLASARAMIPEDEL